MAVREIGGCEVYDEEKRGTCLAKTGLEIHRIIRGSAGGKYVPRNCMVVCKKHHDMLHWGEPGHGTK